MENSVAQYGIEGLLVERRGQNRKGVSTLDHSSPIEKIKRAEARLSFLRLKMNFKKLEALERQHRYRLSSSECSKLINLVNRIYQWTLKKMTPDEYRSHLIAP